MTGRRTLAEVLEWHELRALEVHLEVLFQRVEDLDPPDLLAAASAEARADIEDEASTGRLAAWWAAALASDPVGCLDMASAALGAYPVRLTAGEVRRELRRRVPADPRDAEMGARVACARDLRPSDEVPGGPGHVETYEEQASRVFSQIEARRVGQAEAHRRRLTEDRGAEDREARYVAALLDGVCGDVAALGQGERSHGLYRIAYSLGGHVGAGRLSRERAEDALLSAAAGLGLSERDVRRHVGRGLAAGMRKPRTGR